MTIATKRRPARDYTHLLDAIHFAADKHRYPKRKDAGASAYINHPIAVAEVLVRIGGVGELAVFEAAVLHDTLEDTKTSARQLAARFGARVAGIVAEVTDDTSLPRRERKRRQVEHAARLSRAAKLGKLGDKICNVRDVLESPPERWGAARRLAYVGWAGRVVDACRGTNAGLERHFDRLAARAQRALGGKGRRRG